MWSEGTWARGSLAPGGLARAVQGTWPPHHHLYRILFHSREEAKSLGELWVPAFWLRGAGVGRALKVSSSLSSNFSVKTQASCSAFKMSG